MANGVEIPIYWNVKGNVKKAEKEVKQALGVLQQSANVTPINVRIESKTLMKNVKTINELRAQITLLKRAMATVPYNSPQFAKWSIKLKEDEARLAGLTKGVTSFSAAQRAASAATGKVNAALATQDSYVGRLITRLGLYSGIFAAIRMIKNIRDTTAEFEMQKVALGGIIQDAERARDLFSQIKQAAIKSPFEIKDLVSYTKQLSAYRVETNKLFDVTMRLADVSAGLGVDMSRLILAYGQVRAASVLRGQELRQFTEAGIPLVELLANKFTVLNKRLVSTAEVFELISKRAVPFKMIEEIFEDMTNAGGIFYQMQEKQADTLKGKFMNLKDAVSIAYYEIGNTRAVQGALNGYINILTGVMANWRALIPVIRMSSEALVAYIAYAKILRPIMEAGNVGIWNNIKAQKAKAKVDLQVMALTRKNHSLTKAELASTKLKTAETYKQYIAEKQMSDAELVLYARRNKNNKEIQKAIILSGRLTRAQLKNLMATSRLRVEWTAFLGTLKTGGLQILRGLLSTLKSISITLLKMLPFAAITGFVEVLMANKRAEEDIAYAVENVNKQYRERELAINRLIARYNELKDVLSNASEETVEQVGDSVREGLLAIVQQLKKELSKFGLGDSLNLDYTSLSLEQLLEIIDKWNSFLKDTNSLSKTFDEAVEEAANAAEGPFHVLNRNLTTLIGDLKSRYKELFDKDFRNNIEETRVYLDNLAVTEKATYDEISKAIGQDAKRAFSAKAAAETEYDANMRLLESYEKLMEYKGEMPEIGFAEDIGNYKLTMEGIYNSLASAYESIQDKDPLQIRMVIDRKFAEKEWDSWVKEAYISMLNNARKEVGQELIPTLFNTNDLESAFTGFKQILKTEFPTFITDDEINKIISASDLIDVIDKRLKSAKDNVEKTSKLMANPPEDMRMLSESIERIQKEINEETAKGDDADTKKLLSLNEQLLAMQKMNDVAEEQFEKARKTAEEEYRITKAVKERFSGLGLSSVAQQVKDTYVDVIADELKALTDAGYSSEFLFNEQDLKKIKNAGDLYDEWKKKVSSLNSEIKKLSGVGLSEKRVEEETTRLEAQRVELTSKLAAVNEELRKNNLETVYNNYKLLTQERAKATTAKELESVQKRISELLRNSLNADSVRLFNEKEVLEAKVNSANISKKANEETQSYLTNLSLVRDKLLEIGQDWGFILTQTEGAVESMFSFFAKDIKTTFPELMLDPFKQLNDPNYSVEFLISEDQLSKMKNIGEVYDYWESTTKKIKERQQEISTALISNATITNEIAKNEQRRASIQEEIASIDEKITEEDEKQAKAFDDLVAQREKHGRFTKDRRKIEADIAKIQEQENWEETYRLAKQKESLNLQLKEVSTIEGVRDSLKAEQTFISDILIPALDELAKRYNLRLIQKLKTGGQGEDPWILLYKNRMSFMQDFQKGVENFNKFLMKSDAITKERGIMEWRGLSLGFSQKDIASMTGSREELLKWYDDTIKLVSDKIRKMGGKEFAGLGVTAILSKDVKGRILQDYQKFLQELWNQKTDFDSAQLEKDLKDELERLKKDIAHTEAAKNFFNDMLAQTGDAAIARSITVSVYGEVGDGLADSMIEQVEKTFAGLDVSSAIDKGLGRIDYNKLRGFIPQLSKDMRGAAEEIVSNGERANAEWLKDIMKTYEKAKTLEERLTIVRTREAQKRSEIQSRVSDEGERESLTAASYEHEKKEVAEIQAEFLKNSELWSKTFENIEKVGTQSIGLLIDRLKAFIDLYGSSLDPTDLKTLVQELDKLQDAQAERNPWQGLKEGFTEAIAGIKEYKAALEDVNNLTTAEKAQHDNYLQLSDALTSQIAAEKEKLNQMNVTDPGYEEQAMKVKMLEVRLKSLTATYNKVEDAENGVAQGSNKFKAGLSKINSAVGGISTALSSFKNAFDQITGLLELPEDSDAAVAIQGISDAFGVLIGILGAVAAVLTVIQILADSVMADLWPLLVIAAALAAIIAVFKIVTNLKAKHLQEQIDALQEKVDELEESFERLENQMEKTFGSDYIDNYTKRVEALRAEVEAYTKMAELERQKGKKSDSEKVDDYLKSAKEAQDQIVEMQQEVAERMTGTDLASAAKEFAESWIEAYVSFSSTSAAMKEKFEEMVQNMVVQSMAAKLIQNILSPIFDQIDEMAKSGGELTAAEIAAISGQIPGKIGEINAALNGMMAQLAEAGINLRAGTSDLKGVSRDIASASEESILGLAAGINTQNFYISGIYSSVNQILALLQGGPVNAATAATAGTNAGTGEYLSYLPNIAQNTADMVAECRAAAAECRATNELLNKVIKPRGSSTTHVVMTNV